MTTKPEVDFNEVVKKSGMPTTAEAVRTQFNAIAAEEGLITNTSRMSPQHPASCCACWHGR